MNRLTRLPLLMMLACISILIQSCAGGDEGDAKSSKNVAQIFSENCINCHNNNSVGTFSLALDEGGRQNAELYKDQISSTVFDKTMPPWLVDGEGSCNTFSNDKSMSNGEINAIVAWADADGNADSLGSALPPPPLPTLDRVDLTVKMAQPYPPPPTTLESTEVSRCFLVDAPPIDNTLPDKFITAFEVVPGNKKIVHHVILYGINDVGTEDTAKSYDDIDLDIPGYECFGSSGFSPDRSPILVSWTPGTGATNLPSGTGLRLIRGRKLIMQVHYDTSAYAVGATVDPDLTQIKFALEDEPNVTQAFVMAFEKTNFGIVGEIPALPKDQPNIEETLTDSLKSSPWVVLGILPHMHTFGTSLHLEKIAANGKSSCLMDVPVWDFEWQQFFFYSTNRTPIVIGATDQIKITCKYSTIDALSDVGNGPKKDEEMCAAYFYVIPKI